MHYIFANLKRFDVPRTKGGLCPIENSKEWILDVLDKSAEYGLGTLEDITVAYLLPESLLISANEHLNAIDQASVPNLYLGSQGVHWQDVEAGKNFGAFTTSLPAAAVNNINVDWAIIGHSEERRDKQQVMQYYDQNILADDSLRVKAARAVDSIINLEVHAALHQGIKVLFCLGETSEERGEGNFEEQKPRIRTALKTQLLEGLKGIDQYSLDKSFVIGYEPIWAIGPGKTPPGKEYISFVSSYIRDVVNEAFGFLPPVVYGGGLKKDNAGIIASVDSLAGGLVALTKFTDPIGFDVEQFKEIIDTYRA